MNGIATGVPNDIDAIIFLEGSGSEVRAKGLPAFLRTGRCSLLNLDASEEMEVSDEFIGPLALIIFFQIYVLFLVFWEMNLVNANNLKPSNHIVKIQVNFIRNGQEKYSTKVLRTKIDF